MCDPTPTPLRYCVLHTMARVYRRVTAWAGGFGSTFSNTRDCTPIIHILYTYIPTAQYVIIIMHCVITIIAHNGRKFSMVARGIKMINNHN